MELRVPGTNTLAETRSESEETVDKRKRYQQIIEILKDYPNGLTAKEIAHAMMCRNYTPTSERNFSSPRLTKMLKLGLVDCIGKKICIYTSKKVGVFVLRRGVNAK